MSESLITKRAIASALKELMKKRDIDKISVADIVHQCGINRQTFYYHFQDKFDLIDWIYYNDVISTVENEKKWNKWSEKLQYALTIIRREKEFYTGALKRTDSNPFQDFFFTATRDLILGAMEKFSEEKTMGEEDRRFTAEFYTYGLVGMVAQWVRNGMKESPQFLVARLNTSLTTANALQRHAMTKNTSEYHIFLIPN